MISLFRTMLLRPRRVPCPLCCGDGVLRTRDEWYRVVRIACPACFGWGRLSRKEARCLLVRIVEEGDR